MQMLTMQNQPKSSTQHHSVITFGDAADLFLQECKVRNLTRESIRRYSNGLKKFLQYLKSGNKNVFSLTAYDLTHTIIPGMLDEGLALRTVNSNICILKEFFKFLANEGWMESNIAAELRRLR
jgi:integrase/recombinase XerD